MRKVSGMKIVVRGANWIGDSVMTIPALRHLRRAFPEDSISLYTRPWAEGVFRDADFIDEIIPIENAGVFRQARELRKHNFDLAILFPNSFESALVARLAGIPKRLGYATERRGMLLTESVPVPEWKNERHESNYYLNLVSELTERCGSPTVREGVNTDLEVTPSLKVGLAPLPVEIGYKNASPLLNVSDKRKQAARTVLETAGVDPSKPLIAFGTGSTNSMAKRWPAAYFAELADALADRLNAHVILMGTPNESDVARTVVAAMASTPIDLTGKTDLATATAILGVADLFVSNDMGLAHIAAATGTPTIVIFGPTNEKTTHPLGPYVELVREQVECSPCMLRVCPIDHRCMTRITPTRVFESALKMLETQRR